MADAILYDLIGGDLDNVGEMKDILMLEQVGRRQILLIARGRNVDCIKCDDVTFQS